MDPITVTFLVIGGVSVLLLALSLVFGDFLDWGLLDADGPFTLPVVASFLGTVGFVGAAAAALLPGGTAVSIGVATVAGVIAAVPVAWLTGRLTRAAMTMSTDATLTRDHLLGATGVVVTPIQQGGYGEVRLSLQGQRLKFNARADQPLPAGAQVFVVQALSETSVLVERLPLDQSTAGSPPEPPHRSS